jgi:hypothetical protein
MRHEREADARGGGEEGFHGLGTDEGFILQRPQQLKPGAFGQGLDDNEIAADS